MLRFYKIIKKLPNVKILSPNTDLKRLIKNSEGLITITGTAGFEAIFLGIPVYCLGNPFYSKLPVS